MLTRVRSASTPLERQADHLRLASKVADVGLQAARANIRTTGLFLCDRSFVSPGVQPFPQIEHTFAKCRPSHRHLQISQVATARILGCMTNDAPPMKFALLTSPDPAIRREALQVLKHEWEVIVKAEEDALTNSHLQSHLDNGWRLVYPHGELAQNLTTAGMFLIVDLGFVFPARPGP
jgi:hypothetical protein